MPICGLCMWRGRAAGGSMSWLYIQQRLPATIRIGARGHSLSQGQGYGQVDLPSLWI
jgi:hypothetical protein